MTDDRASGGWEALRAVPTTWKALITILGIVLSVLSGAAGAAIRVDSYVDAKIEAHNSRPKTEKPEKGPHPEFAEAINATKGDIGATRNAVAAVLRNQAMETCWKARIQAPDFEPDARRRKEAADFAENACSDSIEAQRKALIEMAARSGGGAELADSWLDLRKAFRTGVDAVPPWRGIRGAH